MRRVQRITGQEVRLDVRRRTLSSTVRLASFGKRVFICVLTKVLMR